MKFFYEKFFNNLNFKFHANTYNEKHKSIPLIVKVYVLLKIEWGFM